MFVVLSFHVYNVSNAAGEYTLNRCLRLLLFSASFIVRRISLGGSPSIGGFSSLIAFVYSASKSVGVAPAPRVASPGSPVGQGRSQGHRRSPLRASGKMVRGRGELGPDPQELLQDADNDGSSGDDESASGSESDRWVPGLSGPAFFWFGRGGPVVPCRQWSPAGGPRAASVSCHGPLLNPGTHQF